MRCLGALESLHSAKRSGPLLAAASLILLVLAAPVSAQNFPSGDGSMQIGDATISIGGGTAILTLPDVTSMMTEGSAATPFPVGQTFKFSDGFGDVLGWNINGAIAVPAGNATVSLNGFWARIEDDHNETCDAVSMAPAGTVCTLAPVVDGPGQQITGAPGGQMFSAANRDVDQWGAALESEWAAGGVAGLLSKQHFAVGADIRGIDQDLDARFTASFISASDYLVTYSENLDTRYYGAYLAWGGAYTPFLFADLWKSWGLVSSFRLHGGIYYANTDYDGQMTQASSPFTFDATSSLSLSRNDVA